MGRKPDKQVRLGKLEKRLVADTRAKLKKYRLSQSNGRKGETRLNELLIDYLKQLPKPISVGNKDIPVVKFAGETFRPEAFVTRKKSNVLCLECKKLVDRFAKQRWKEGLSQAIHYRLRYKVVFLVLYDFTSGATYCRQFGPGRSTETTFAKQLREKLNIHIVALRPQ